MSTNGKAAFLYMFHHCFEGMDIEFDRICKASEGIGDTFLVFSKVNNNYMSEFQASGPNVYVFSDDDLKSIGYKMMWEEMVPGHTHFPVLKFFLEHPSYEYFWFIEYDVRFSGDWRVFFEYFSQRDDDFQTCHIRKYADEPEWKWWRLDNPTQKIQLPDRLRSYNTIYRISNRGLSYLDKMQKAGWSGHHEVLIPTLLNNAGYKIGDFGGIGDYVKHCDRNRFYLEGISSRNGILCSGTMRWRPYFSKVGGVKDKLYHPVKTIDAGNYSWERAFSGDILDN